MDIWAVGTLNQLFIVLTLYSIVLCFVLTTLFVLTLASDRAVLYANVAFSILALSTKKPYSSFFKKVSVSQKICFKVEVLKTFKISSDCCTKTYRFLKRKANLKIPSTVSQKNLPVCFKNETSKKKLFLVLRQKLKFWSKTC